MLKSWQYRSLIYVGLVSNLLVPPDTICFWKKNEFLFHDDSQNTDVWNYCDVYAYICSVSLQLKRHGLLIVKVALTYVLSHVLQIHV